MRPAGKNEEISANFSALTTIIMFCLLTLTPTTLGQKGLNVHVGGGDSYKVSLGRWEWLKGNCRASVLSVAV